MVNTQSLISVIIPALNEEDSIRSCIEAVRAQDVPHEIIIVDGGSSDETVGIAESLGARILKSNPGRAAQMNIGAIEAAGDILIFVHADTILPAGILSRVKKAVVNGLDGGAFTFRFDRVTPLLWFGTIFGNLYCMISRNFMGDRAIFCTRAAFESVGGYSDLRIMEDIDLSDKLKLGKFKTKLLRGPVITSGRRFTGPDGFKIAWWTVKLLVEFHLGVPLDKAAADFYTSRG